MCFENYMEQVTANRIAKEITSNEELFRKILSGEYPDAIYYFKEENERLLDSIEALKAGNNPKDVVAVNEIYAISNGLLWMLSELYRVEDFLNKSAFCNLWNRVCKEIQIAKEAILDKQAGAAKASLKEYADDMSNRFYGRDLEDTKFMSYEERDLMF